MAYSFDESIISDLHKDAYGYRPREWFWSQWNDATDDTKQVIWDNLCHALEDELEREKREQEMAIASFEASVAKNIELGATNRETAIHWMLESMKLSEHDLRYGGSYITYELGLPYEMAKIFDPICKSMLGKHVAWMYCEA